MIGLDIKMRRHILKLRQWELAAKVGYSAAVISDIENGKRQLSPDLEKRISVVLEELEKEKGLAK